LTGRDVGIWCELIEAEWSEYRRLWRLSWRQSRYLQRHDIGRLQTNTLEWHRYLPQARAARQRRQEHVQSLARRLGCGAGATGAQSLLERADENTGARVRRAMARLADAAAEVVRQNELNRQLAAFCLDLAREEAAIFQRCVLADPAGGYAGDAQKTSAPAGGIFVRQA
jgi:hypothetical protein